MKNYRDFEYRPEAGKPERRKSAVRRDTTGPAGKGAPIRVERDADTGNRVPTAPYTESEAMSLPYS